jgi:hypothetical protein
MAAAMAVTLVLAGANLAEACPSCKAALASQEAGGDLVRGFFWSIVFMMSMPFLLVGSFSGYLYLLVRRARAGQAATACGTPVPTATSQADQPAAKGDAAEGRTEV